MHRSLLIALSVIGSIMIGTSAAAAQASYTTKRGYVGCTSLTDFNEQSELLASGDRAAWASYIASPQSSCMFLKAGVRVYMQNAKGLGVIKIRLQGSTIWIYTYTEAVTRA